MERALSVALEEEKLSTQKRFLIGHTHTPLYLNNHLFSLFSLSLHDHTQRLPGLKRGETLVPHHPSHATRADLMWSKFINKVMHVDEENTQVLDLLVTLCVKKRDSDINKIVVVGTAYCWGGWVVNENIQQLQETYEN